MEPRTYNARSNRAMRAAAREVAREISYSGSAATKGGRALIRAVENTTGRINLIKRARGYEHEVAEGRDFWRVMTDRYGLTLDVAAGSLANLPKAGPLIVVSNHPFGILDGLVLGRILSDLRGDFRILAHRVFRKARDLDRVILPVSFDATKDAVQTNLQTRRDALRFLDEGGAIGIFPGGTVSTSKSLTSTPLDPTWRAFTAKMIAKSDATVVPIFFDGTNSRLFQIASHLHYTLRMALLIKEFKARVDTPVKLYVGDPISRDQLDPFAKDSRAMMDFLRARTYALNPSVGDPHAIGFEFEEKYRN